MLSLSSERDLEALLASTDDYDPYKMGRVFRFVPYANYLKCLLIAGRELDSIKYELGARKYNVHPSEVLAGQYHEINKDPVLAQNMTENRIRIVSNQPLEVDYSALKRNFRYPELAYDIIMSQGIKCSYKSKRGLLDQILRINRTLNIRQVVETAPLAMVNMPKIKEKFELLTVDCNLNAISLYAYYYFFWDIKLSTRKELGFTLDDVAMYMRMNPTNIFYSTYAKYLDKTSFDLFYATGVADQKEKTMVNKRQLGMVAEKVETAIASGLPIYDSEAYKLMMYLDQSCNEQEKSEEKFAAVMDEMNRIRATITTLKEEERNSRTIDFYRQQNQDTPQGTAEFIPVQSTPFETNNNK